MAYYRAPAERPRQAKRFLTSREIEDMANAGQTEIVHVDDMVITDAARETAHDLGVRIVKPDQRAAAAPRAPAAPEPATVSVPVTPAQVPGPRVSPVAAAAPVITVRTFPAAGDPLVQALVRAVRSLKG